MSRSVTGGAPPGSRYADQRHYVVAPRLADLRGPVRGTVTIDRWLDWSGSGRYDLANPGRLARMYETVLREASKKTDLSRWLDKRTLARLWRELVLPPQVRSRWEAQFPELASGRWSAA